VVMIDDPKEKDLSMLGDTLTLYLGLSSCYTQNIGPVYFTELWKQGIAPGVGVIRSRTYACLILGSSSGSQPLQHQHELHVSHRADHHSACDIVVFF
jgi:hypothetical protein